MVLAVTLVGCSPTPRVTWTRIGSQSSRHETDSFGHELTIRNVQYSDAGKYECQGLNSNDATPIRRSVQLSVECECLRAPSFDTVQPPS